VLTSFPPQPCVTAPQYKWDRSAAAALPYTNLIAHILTQKTCVANHNIICPKAAQEDTIDDYVSSTPGPSQYDLASLPTYHRRIHINSTLSSLSQESNPVASSNIFSSFTSSFHTPLLPSFAPFLWTSAKNSSRPSNSSQSQHLVCYR
jgi:hypothetical protein